MPTYEYRCPEGHDFEVFQKMSDEPGATCPECGKPAERQLSAGAGFLFKGEGFYITDYRSADYKERAKKESGASSGSSSSEGGASGASKGEAAGGSSGGSAGSSGGSSGSSTPGSGGSSGSSSTDG